MKIIDDSIVYKAIRNLKKSKVFTAEDLMNEIDCSYSFARSVLKTQSALSSLNHNARFYTLPQNLKFNQDGLWFYRDVAFSSHGNLTKTVVALVKNSNAGLSFNDLKYSLRMKTHSIQSMLPGIAELKIEKLNGRLFYFFNEKDIYEGQKVERESLIQKDFIVRKSFSEIEALWILIERLIHPRKSLQQLCDKLKSKIGLIERQHVEKYFRKRGIDIKKNPPSP